MKDSKVVRPPNTTSHQGDEENSFYRVFSFDYLMFDAGDQVIIFFDCRITRDIPQLGLHLGEEFEQVAFDFSEANFSFSNYASRSERKAGDLDGTEYEDEHIIISQGSLAPYLTWISYNIQIQNKYGEWEDLKIPPIDSEPQKRAILEALEKAGVNCRAKDID